LYQVQLNLRWCGFDSQPGRGSVNATLQYKFERNLRILARPVLTGIRALFFSGSFVVVHSYAEKRAQRVAMEKVHPRRLFDHRLFDLIC